jgi:hypothetical protein
LASSIVWVPPATTLQPGRQLDSFPLQTAEVELGASEQAGNPTKTDHRGETGQRQKHQLIEETAIIFGVIWVIRKSKQPDAF